MPFENLPHNNSRRGYRRQKARRNIPISDRIAIKRRFECAPGAKSQMQVIERLTGVYGECQDVSEVQRI